MPPLHSRKNSMAVRHIEPDTSGHGFRVAIVQSRFNPKIGTGLLGGALRALREAKVRIPEDIALAGFDDIPIARYLTPPLTTVRVEIAEMGRRAVDYLVNTLESGTDGSRKHDVVATTLVVRESCGSQLSSSPSSRTRTKSK